MQERLRAVDLARAAGISVQQVRNYVAAGVLPPVERTPGGYRVFTAAHAEALGAAREVAAGHGWRTARTVMGAIHAGDLETALAALDAGHAELDRQRAELATVRAALDALLARQDGPAAAAGRGLRIGQVARAVGVRPSVLRVWETRGLLLPSREPSTGYRRYSSSEVRMAQVTALLRRAGQPFGTVRAVLDELRTTGSPERARGELARRERDLYRRSVHQLRASTALWAYLEQHAPPDAARRDGGTAPVR